jgi:hypothetical protein
MPCEGEQGNQGRKNRDHARDGMAVTQKSSGFSAIRNFEQGQVIPISVGDAPKLERAVAAFARSGNGGMIVSASALAAVHRDLIITLAARHKLPAVHCLVCLEARSRLALYRQGDKPRRPQTKNC